MPKGRVTFDVENCKGCSNCVVVCPTKIISLDEKNMNSWGYYPATVVEMEKCIGCSNCAVMCPDLVITVERFKEEKKES